MQGFPLSTSPRKRGRMDVAHDGLDRGKQHHVPTVSLHTFSTQVCMSMVRAPPVYLLHNMDIHVPTYLEMYLHTQTLHTSYMNRHIIRIVCSTSYNRYITGSLLKPHVFNRPCSVSLPILRPSTTSTTFSNGLKQQFSFGGTASYHARSGFLKALHTTWR